MSAKDTAIRITASVLLAMSILTGCSFTESTPAYIGSEFGNVPNVVGMQLQESWERLVDDGYLPRISSSEQDGKEPGTVVSIEVIGPADGTYSYIPDPSGVIHEELNDREWKAEVAVTVTGMRQIPPSLTLNHTEAEAREELDRAGFTNIIVETDSDYDPDNNRVIEVNPLPSAWVAPDQEIIAKASSYVTMPDIIGKQPVEASGTLTLEGLVPDPNITSWYRSDEAGWDIPTVVSTSLKAGEKAKVGTTVHVEYSGTVEGTRHTVE